MWSVLTSKPFVTICLAAFLLRAGMAVVVQYVLDHRWQREFVIPGDADGYWQLGQKIANGESYAIYDPPRSALRMPGFPAMLAVPIRLANGNMLITRLWLAVFGSLVCGCVYWLGRATVSETVGIMAAAFTVISPAMAGFSVMILSEIPFALGVTLSLVGLVRVLKSCEEQATFGAPIKWAVLTGVFAAIAVYLRPSWLPFAILAPLGVIVCRRFSVASMIAGATIFLVTMGLLAPWAWRNQKVTGHWVWTTLWSGPSLYDGLHPFASGESDMAFYQEDNLLARMSEYEVNQYYWTAAWDYAKAHPGRAIELGLVKLWRFWKPWPSAEESGNWVTRSVIAGFSLLLYAGTVLGCWLYRRQWTVLAVNLGPVLFFAALHSLFVGSLRYRLPAEFPMSVLAAAGWLGIIERWRQPTDSQRSSA